MVGGGLALDEGAAEGEGAQAPGDVLLAGVLADEGAARGVGVAQRPGVEGGDGAHGAGVDDEDAVVDRDGGAVPGAGADQLGDLLGGGPRGGVGGEAGPDDALARDGEADVQFLTGGGGGLEGRRGGVRLDDLGGRDGRQALLADGALRQFRRVGDEELACDQRRAVRHS